MSTLYRRVPDLDTDPFSQRPVYNGNTDNRSPFRPGAVIYLCTGVAKQVFGHKPGQGSAVAQAAIGNKLLVRRRTCSGINFLQFGPAFVGVVFIQQVHVIKMPCARNVPFSDGTMIHRKPVGGYPQTDIFFGRTHVQQDPVRVIESGQYAVAPDAAMRFFQGPDGIIDRRETGDGVAG